LRNAIAIKEMLYLQNLRIKCKANQNQIATVPSLLQAKAVTRIMFEFKAEIFGVSAAPFT
jgi:hypothetical protein